MKHELVVATKNKKKLKEIKEILKDLNLKITFLADYPQIPAIIEDKTTFKGNAIKKAVLVASITEKLTLGEDSGLCVNALGGKPGVYSARFAEKCGCRLPAVPLLKVDKVNNNDLRNNLKLLKLLKGIAANKRKAYYVCAVALADKDGLIGVTEGKCWGSISFELKGKSGFGYDPLFIPQLSKIPKVIKGKEVSFSKNKKTFAELGKALKHKISHRFRALDKAKKLVGGYLNEKFKFSSKTNA